MKTLIDVIKFVNEYWDICHFKKWGETPIGQETIEKLEPLGQFIIYFGNDTLTSSGDF